MYWTVHFPLLSKIDGVLVAVCCWVVFWPHIGAVQGWGGMLRFSGYRMVKFGSRLVDKTLHSEVDVV